MRIVSRAFVRPVSPTLASCQVTHIARAPIDVALAEAQHAAYGDALRQAGVVVDVLPAAPHLPDAVFVEDAALILDDLIIVTRPGSEGRQEETVTVAAALAGVAPVSFIREPATLDGGDVLRMGHDLFVGTGGRTSREGFDQLTAIASRFGYRTTPVDVRGCLHLKTAVTAIDEGTVLIHTAHIDRGVFAAFDAIEADAAEPSGANVLAINGRVHAAASAPRTHEAIDRRGYDVDVFDISEFEKAEAGMTCLSLLL
ncbi:MAG: dimethylargininase [Acidobacteria bacterium]|nr:dimethylargininase [Acidobacteriota bacterium]